MKRKPYRHGDVLIVPIDSLPGKLTPVARQAGRVILAEGKVTGHAHAIVEKEVSLYELVTPGDVADMRRRFLRVENEVANLVHEEHATIALPPGQYEVIRQQEYQGERWARVAD